MGRGRAPCCDKVGLKKGSWTPAEDMKLMAYIQKYGHGNWRALPKQAGLLRCGKSCRLRWINYLRPDIKRGSFSAEEEETIIRLHQAMGNKWSKIASRLPGRTDNEIKNVWNTYLKKRVSTAELVNPLPEEQPTSSSSHAQSPSPPCSDQVLGGGGGPEGRGLGVLREDDEETSGAQADRKTLLEGIIEIPVEANLDMWDMLEPSSPRSGIWSSTEDIREWDVDWDAEQLPFHQLHYTLTEKRSLSACSSISDITHCNSAEGPGGAMASQPGEDLVKSHRLQAPAGNIVPTEPELWNFFEEFGSSFLYDTSAGVDAERGPPGKGDVEGNRWIAYLEKELELPGQGVPGQGTPPTVSSLDQPPNTEQDKMTAGSPSEEVDPITCYFDRQHSNASPFSLSLTDICMA